MAALSFVFFVVASYAGAILLIAGALYVAARATVWLLTVLKIWYTLALAASMLKHGPRYRDRLFWQAIQERASRSRFEAKNIANHAMKAAPAGGESEEL